MKGGSGKSPTVDAKATASPSVDKNAPDESEVLFKSQSKAVAEDLSHNEKTPEPEPLDLETHQSEDLETPELEAEPEDLETAELEETSELEEGSEEDIAELFTQTSGGSVPDPNEEGASLTAAAKEKKEAEENSAEEKGKKEESKVSKAWDDFNKTIQEPAGKGQSDAEAAAEAIAKLLEIFFSGAEFSIEAIKHPQQAFRWTKESAIEDKDNAKEYFQGKVDAAKDIKDKGQKGYQGIVSLINDLKGYSKKVQEQTKKLKENTKENLQEYAQKTQQYAKKVKDDILTAAVGTAALAAETAAATPTATATPPVATPVAAEEETFPALGEESPTALAEETFAEVAEETPVEVEEGTPAEVEEATPPVVEEETSAAVEEEIFAEIEEATPAAVEEEIPAVETEIIEEVAAESTAAPTWNEVKAPTMDEKRQGTISNIENMVNNLYSTSHQIMSGVKEAADNPDMELSKDGKPRDEVILGALIAAKKCAEVGIGLQRIAQGCQADTKFANEYLRQSQGVSGGMVEMPMTMQPQDLVGEKQAGALFHTTETKKSKAEDFGFVSPPSLPTESGGDAVTPGGPPASSSTTSAQPTEKTETPKSSGTKGGGRK